MDSTYLFKERRTPLDAPPACCEVLPVRRRRPRCALRIDVERARRRELARIQAFRPSGRGTC